MIANPTPLQISDKGKILVQIDDLKITSNKITFLFGESGIGKTLISKAIYGLLDPAQLEVSLGQSSYEEYLISNSVKARKQNSFFVFQEPSSHLNPVLTIKEQLREGTLKENLNESDILRQLWQDSPADQIQNILNTFPKPYRPSGGEKQRILLAMAFKKIELLKPQQPTFFVFDEPTGSLDNRYRNIVLDRIYHYYNKKAYTLLFITHDYSIIHELYERHRSFLPFTEFKELYRLQDRQSALRTFLAEDYLSWEKEIKPGKANKVQHSPTLTISNRFTVFNQNIKIYEDAGHKQPKDLRVYPGSLVYLKAPSGVGKTTLAKIIMGLIQSQCFNATISNQELNTQTQEIVWRKKIWGKKAGMVFQHADEGLNLRANILQTFSALPLKEKINPQRLATILDQVFSDKVDIHFLKKNIGQLSGGQKQRINIMRSLLLNTALTILDEPLNGLDFESIQKILELIELQRLGGSSFLIISHNEDIFDRLTLPENVFYLERERMH